MHLPVPNAEEIDRFKALCEREYGFCFLNDAIAQHYATKIVQLFYVKNYGIHPLCPPLERN